MKPSEAKRLKNLYKRKQKEKKMAAQATVQYFQVPGLDPVQFPPGSPQIVITLNPRGDVNLHVPPGLPPITALGALHFSADIVSHSTINPRQPQAPRILPATAADLAAVDAAPKFDTPN